MDTKFVYSVYDSVACEYGLPVLFNNDIQACRSFEKEIINNKDIYSPDDYKLYCIGYFNTVTGVLTPCDPPVLSHPEKSFNEEA